MTRYRKINLVIRCYFADEHQNYLKSLNVETLIINNENSSWIEMILFLLYI